ncbi:MAG: ammonium transporter [Chloroflexaceae bacterium]|nr:ammonium transporter [Chloroflexaceae bacterium]
MERDIQDILWVAVCAALVFVMQLGFLCLETGLTRSKNNINVAMKNLADFAVSTAVFWAVGFALMFGVSAHGWIGQGGFAPTLTTEDVWRSIFFLFQVMFCGTSVTILSGSVAERLNFRSFLLIVVVIAGLIYPLFGHWVWNGNQHGEAQGWLAQLGFVDFAGSSVVHSLGGWVALALLLIIGPRQGRFPPDKPPQKIPAANIPMAALGVMLLWLGWFGFNGGSTLALNPAIAPVLINTLLAGTAGPLAALLLSWWLHQRSDVEYLLNGVIAGLVAITASCHAVSTSSALLIGAIGGAVMVAADALLVRWHIDDAVGAVPTHLAAGIWGTLAVALFGDPLLLDTGLDRWQQLLVQGLGILVCAGWAGGISFGLLWMFNRWSPLRVSAETERIGLNIAEHHASSDLLELLLAMEQQAQSKDMSQRMPVEPFTEVGQIAARYNATMQALEQTTRQHEAMIQTTIDAIVFFQNQNQAITAVNPAAEILFGYPQSQLLGRSVTVLLAPGEMLPAPDGDAIYHELTALHAEGFTFPVETTLTIAEAGGEDFGIGIFRDISERKYTQETLQQRDAILESVSFAAHQLLELGEFDGHIEGALQRLGQATQVSRVYIFELRLDDDHDMRMYPMYEWVADGVAPKKHRADIQGLSCRHGPFQRWSQFCYKASQFMGISAPSPKQRSRSSNHSRFTHC